MATAIAPIPFDPADPFPDGRSVFIEFETEAAAKTFIVDAAILGLAFTLNGIMEHSETEHSVYFSLPIDHLTDEGFEQEQAFIAIAAASGGQYTGS